MPINVFGNRCSSQDYGIKVDTSIFVQKPYLRTNYLESKEEDIHMKNQFKNRKLPCPVKNTYAAKKTYIDSGLIDCSIIRNTAYVDFNDKNLYNVRFDKVNSLHAVREHLTPKFYVDEVVFYRVADSSI